MSKRLKKLKSRGSVTTTVNNLSHEGRGIAHIDGKTTFIYNALPEETVSFRYTQSRSSYDVGETVEVIQASNKRVEPACEVFTRCGGCQLQHLSHQDQLDHKISQFKQQLSHANISPENWLMPLTASPWHYRSKARLGVKNVEKKGDVLVGFREQSSPYVVEMNRCPVLIDAVGERIQNLRQLLTHLSCKSQIPQIEVAATAQETALIIRHLVDLPDDDVQQLISFCRQHHFKLYLQPKGTDSIHLVHPCDGEFLMQYHLQAFNLNLKFHPAGFIQVNDAINQQMVKQAIDCLALKPEDRVLDLFCGIGNFSLAAATQSQQVVGVEGDELAVTLAKANAQANQLPHAQFYCQNLFEPNNRDGWLTQTYDKVILDPPRSGAKEIIPYLSAMQVRKIAYISCNPMTFVRDCQLLAEQGFKLQQAGVMDMFPHTQHLEVMGIFVRSN